MNKKIETQIKIINDIFTENNVKAKIINYSNGPRIVEYVIEVENYQELDKIKKLKNTFMLKLSVLDGFRMLSPKPGTKYCVLEVPKDFSDYTNVDLNEILESDEFKHSKLKLPVVIGKDVNNKVVLSDITLMPHCLMLGMTRGGKTQSIYSFIVSLIVKLSPEELRLILVDLKQVTLNNYEQLPHLALPIIKTPEEYKIATNYLVNEMRNRFELLANENVKSIDKLSKKLPYIVMIIDEYDSLLEDEENENQIFQLVAKARAVGIHIILSTQSFIISKIKPSIRMNMATVIAYRIAALEDANVIGFGEDATNLMGSGDLLLKYAGAPIVRIQGAYINRVKIKEIVSKLSKQYHTPLLMTKEQIEELL